MNVDPDKLRDEFSAFIATRPFPCVGAKSALASHSIETFVARDIQSAWDDLAIHARLCDFAARVQFANDRVFRSFAVLYETPVRLSEKTFERVLWERLQSLHDKDRWLSYGPDRRVSADPASSDFAFSVGGEGFFVVGMHPGSSRLSRRSPMPALVFNPFAQFERLRQEGQFDRMSAVVRQRDEALCGSPNPMLANHGDDSAARQFSGRAVEAEWACPMRTGAADGRSELHRRELHALDEVG